MFYQHGGNLNDVMNKQAIENTYMLPHAWSIDRWMMQLKAI